MYLILIFLVPFLFLFNTRLAMVGLVAAIVWMCVQRTRPRKGTSGTSRPSPPPPASQEYEAGYK